MGKYFIDHIYYALETGFGNSWTPMGAGDIHQAFNPIIGDIEVPRPKYEEELNYTADSLDYNPDVSYDKDLTPGKGTFPGGDGMIYRDPFLMACAFPHKTVTGTWGGGAGTYGKITGDFSDKDDRSSIMIQCGNTDGSSPINRCYNGGLIINYLLGFKKGGALRESVELNLAYYQTNTQAFSSNSNFDDGRWSLWALKNATQKYYHATNMKLYWDDSHIAELSGLKIESCQFKIGIPKALEDDYSDLRHQHEWDKNRIHECTVSGILYGDAELLEAEKMFKDKIKKDLRMSWDQTANKTKWMQIVDAWITGLSTHKLPAIQNAVKIDYTFKGKTSQFEGNFENVPDPSSRIDA